LELTLTRLTKKVGQLLACKLYTDLVDFIELRHNIIWLHPILFELILIYGSQYLDRGVFLDFLDEFFWNKPKIGHSERYNIYWLKWKNNGEDKVKNLSNYPLVKKSRELISVRYSLRRFNEKHRFIAIDVFPSEILKGQIIESDIELELPF
jgi:hypothetical protein